MYTFLTCGYVVFPPHWKFQTASWHSHTHLQTCTQTHTHARTCTCTHTHTHTHKQTHELYGHWHVLGQNSKRLGLVSRHMLSAITSPVRGMWHTTSRLRYPPPQPSEHCNVEKQMHTKKSDILRFRLCMDRLVPRPYTRACERVWLHKSKSLGPLQNLKASNEIAKRCLLE